MKVHIRFSQSKSDNSLFIYKKGLEMAYILLYVDDIILTASSVALRKSIMLLLNSKFAMKDLGPLSYFLGIAITQHVGSLLLSQKKYANKIIEHACMSSCKPCPTPVDTKPKLSAKTSTPYEDPTHYRSLVKALNTSHSRDLASLMSYNRSIYLCIIQWMIICMLSGASCTTLRVHFTLDCIFIPHQLLL